MNSKNICIIFLCCFLIIIFIAVNTHALNERDRDRALPRKIELTPEKPAVISEKQIKFPSSLELSDWLKDTKTFPIAPFEPLNIQKLNRDNFKPPANRTNSSAHKALGTSIDYISALLNGAKHLVRLQSDVTEDNSANGSSDVDLEDGGWDWQIDSTITAHSGSTSPENTYGATAGGVLGAYNALGGKAYPPSLSTFTSLEDAYSGMLADLNIDSGCDFPFLVRLSEKTGDNKYANLARARYDAKLTAFGGSKALADAIVNARGVNGDGIIPWDINFFAVGAAKLNEYFPGQGYDAGADTFAQVIYEDIYNNNPGYFDETNKSEWWWTSGIAGALEAFTVSGTHLTERDQLAATLLNYQNDGVTKTPKGAWDWNDDYAGGDYQTTAYAIMALMAYGGTLAKSACIEGVNWLVGDQRANGGWYWDDWYEYTEEVGEVLWAISLLVPNEVWVDDNYNSSTPGWGYDHFDKIQDGIDAVAYAGKVNVASGTYNVVQIRISKAVSLSGAGSTTTIIDGGKSDLNAYGDGMVLVTSSATGTIMIDGFTLQNPGYTGTVPDDWVLTMVDYINTATLTVQNCHFIGYGPSDPDHWDYAFYVVKNNSGTVAVQNNEFEQMWAAVLIELPEGPVKILDNNIHHLQSQIYPPEPPPIGPVYSAYGVFATTYGGHDVFHLQQVNGNTFSDYAGRSVHFVGGYPDVTGVNKFTNVEIKNNTIKAIGTGPENQHAGIILANAGTTPADASHGGVDNAVISGNIIKGSGGTDSYALRLRGPNNNAIIQDNIIDNVNNGIAVEEWYSGTGAASGLDIYRNIIMCNTANAIDNGSSNTWDNGIDKGNFWDDWASNSGYPTQYNVFGTAGSIDHYPQAPSAVWVDDNWAVTPCGDSVGGHLFGYDAFNKIQDGIDAVASGGIVNVLTGTYNENIVIPKPMSLLGAGSDSVVVYPAISDIGQPNPQDPPSFKGSQICVVQAQNVTIEGFILDGDSPTLTPPGTLDARNGIITNYNLGDYSNLKVQNCTVKNVYMRGIYAAAKNPNNLTGVDFNHNNVSNAKGISMQSAGMMLWGSSGTVKHNNVADASLGIFYHWYSDGNMDSNTVTGCELGLGVNSNDLSTSISYNSVASSDQGIQTVYILAPANVTFNSLDACSVGVMLYGGGTGQNNIWDNVITGLGYPSSGGVWTSTDPYGAVLGNLKRNTIKGNIYGVILSEPSSNPSKAVSVMIGGDLASRNFIYDNLGWELLMDYCNNDQNATYNYWGKSTFAQIEEEVFHKVDQSYLGLVDFDPAILHGDVNLDGQLSVADIVYLINYLFKGGPAPELFLIADINRDGNLTVSDVVYLINYLFKGGPAPKIITSESAEAGIGKVVVDKSKISKPVNLHSVEK